MTGPRPIRQSGAFVPGPGGPRFRLVSEPAQAPVIGTVVFVPAFAEEMNKSRRMVARLARLLAADGWLVVQRDLLGCGDSAGDFADATWSSWLGDVEAELEQAPSGLPVWLWCHRAGALLAPPALATRPSVNLLLWQPVVSGAQHLQQFLRLHAGARIVSGARAEGETTPAQALRSGQSVEVAGYMLTLALTGGLEKAKFEVPDGHAGRVEILETHLEADAADLPPRVTMLVDALVARGVPARAQSVPGPAFWLTQEIEECEALLAASVAALRGEDARTAAHPTAEHPGDPRA